MLRARASPHPHSSTPLQGRRRERCWSPAQRCAVHGSCTVHCARHYTVRATCSAVAREICFCVASIKQLQTLIPVRYMQASGRSGGMRSRGAVCESGSGRVMGPQSLAPCGAREHFGQLEHALFAALDRAVNEQSAHRSRPWLTAGAAGGGSGQG